MLFRGSSFNCGTRIIFLKKSGFRDAETVALALCSSDKALFSENNFRNGEENSQPRLLCLLAYALELLQEVAQQTVLMGLPSPTTRTRFVGRPPGEASSSAYARSWKIQGLCCVLELLQEVAVDGNIASPAT